MDDLSKLPAPPTASVAEQPLQPAPATEPPLSAGRGVKETVESILIAFILAFVFRAFVVEAFVIPTGSMAPTLLGAHLRATCKECGYEVRSNFSTNQESSDEINIPDRAGPRKDGSGKLVDVDTELTCPNCRFRFTQQNAPISYGDRILVLKYLYIPWVSPNGPQRWDVVVFKNPTDSPNYAVNYIKRLVGLPHEWLMILDGDVYVCDARTYDIDRAQARDLIPATAWNIQDKPKYAQDALWRIIYDHDYRPLEENRADGWTLPWVQTFGSGWRTGAEPGATPAERRSRVITFNELAAAGELTFDAAAVPKATPQRRFPAHYLTDWLGYDATMFPDRYPVYPVSDLKLAFSYERKAGDGPLTAKFEKFGHQFALRFDPGQVLLTHGRPDGQKSEVQPARAFNPSASRGPIRVEFENVDYRVRVRLNGDLAFETTRQEYGPDIADLLKRHIPRYDEPTGKVSISAARQEAALSHVSLWRDVYYTPESAQTNAEILHARPGFPMKLGTDEFFVMGDNSAGSHDGRYWDHRINLPDEDLTVESGRVPGRFMLGRAFFVYWPAGYRPLSTAPALVPNFGEMRLIQ